MYNIYTKDNEVAIQAHNNDDLMLKINALLHAGEVITEIIVKEKETMETRHGLVFLFTLENLHTKEIKVIEGYSLFEAREDFGMDLTPKFWCDWKVLYCEEMIFHDGVLIK